MVPVVRSMFDPVILGAADSDVGIGRMDGDALELRGSQGGVVLIHPGVAAIGRFPDAAIIAAIDDDWIGRGELDHVSIGMSGGGVTGEGGGAAVERGGLLPGAGAAGDIAA